MPFSRRARVRAAVVLAAYLVFTAFVVFWPTPVDRPFAGPLFRFLGSLRQYGIRPIDAYNALESGSNVLFFVPAGVLFVLVIGRSRWWLAPIIGLAVSSIIEAAQTAFLVERTGTLSDVIANTAGALLGSLIGVLIARRVERRAVASVADERVAPGKARGRRAAGPDVAPSP